IVTLLVSFAKPLIGMLFVINSEDKATARILGLVLVEIIGYTALYVTQMKKGKVFFSKRFWKYSLMYSLPLIPHYLSQTVLNSADRIIIKDICSDGEAGIYSLAYSISLIMTLFNTAFMQTISPWLYQKIKDKKVTEISKIAYVSLVLIAGVNILLIICAPEVIAVFAPESYYEAIWIIPPVAMSVYFMYSYDLFAKFAFYYEKTTFVMFASIIGAALNVVLNYIFINMFGYIAAGYTTLFCYVIYSVCHYIFMNIVCNKFCDGVKPYNLIIILLITLPFLTLGFVMLFTYSYPLIRYSLIVLILICAVIFRKKLLGVVKSFRSLRN
ncbi:MAG: oligosaccharide flippase family protein, partial [Oscillospiraceae bacterium]|nr:oligosaccharide flippase family protein [Oscillospiraceae bacterium]